MKLLVLCRLCFPVPGCVSSVPLAFSLSLSLPTRRVCDHLSLNGCLVRAPNAGPAVWCALCLWHPHQVPTANNALIMAQVAGAGAEAVALVIFWQYLVAPLFVSGWTALALATLWPKVVT